MASVPTKFMSEDETEASAAWSAIEAGHGLVNVEPSWAAEKALPETIRSPTDPSQAVYVISAYHEIHCLVSLGQF